MISTQTGGDWKSLGFVNILSIASSRNPEPNFSFSTAPSTNTGGASELFKRNGLFNAVHIKLSTFGETQITTNTNKQTFTRYGWETHGVGLGLFYFQATRSNVR